MSNSARSQLQGIAGLNTDKSGLHLKTPAGFGVVTAVFGDMRRHFPGTWFADVHSQQDLNVKAELWRHRLSRFSEQVVRDAMAEIVVRGDVSAPKLNTFAYLCQRITDENVTSNKTPAAINARYKAMQKIKDMGVIRG